MMIETHDYKSARAVLSVALEGNPNAAGAFVNNHGQALIACVEQLTEAVMAYHAAFLKADAAQTWATFEPAAEVCVAARLHLFGLLGLPYTPAEPIRLVGAAPEGRV